MAFLPLSREEVLAVGRQLMREGGWAAFSMRSVAERCGVTVRWLYGSFGSKAKLLSATAESVWYEIFTLPEDLPEERRFLRCVEGLYQNALRGGRRYPDFLTVYTRGFVAGGDPEGRRMLERARVRLQEALCRELTSDRQVCQAVFDDRLTREGFVDLVLSMMLTALFRKKEDCGELLALIWRVLY